MSAAATFVHWVSTSVDCDVSGQPRAAITQLNHIVESCVVKTQSSYQTSKPLVLLHSNHREGPHQNLRSLGTELEPVKPLSDMNLGWDRTPNAIAGYKEVLQVSQQPFIHRNPRT